jgi:dolichol kinase
VNARTVTGPAPVRAELARKALHLSSAVLPVAWGLGALPSTQVRALLLVAASLALAVEAARRRWPAVQHRFVVGVGALLRPHERTALTGATWLALAMLGAALLLPGQAAIVALWAAAVGDGLASVVGRLAARGGGAKTWAGSITCALATALGASWLVAAPPLAALVVGAIAAAAERPRLALDDNVRVAAAAGLAAWVLLVA